MFCEANSFNSHNSLSLTYNPRIMQYIFSSQNVTKFFPLWWEVGGAKNLFSLFSFLFFSNLCHQLAWVFVFFALRIV